MLQHALDSDIMTPNDQKGVQLNRQPFAIISNNFQMTHFSYIDDLMLRFLDKINWTHENDFRLPVRTFTTASALGNDK